MDEDRSKLVATSHPSAVRIEGAVYDGAGEPVPDAMVEIWQANAYGRFDDPTDDRENLPLDPETFSGLDARVPTPTAGSPSSRLSLAPLPALTATSRPTMSWSPSSPAAS